MYTIQKEFFTLVLLVCMLGIIESIAQSLVWKKSPWSSYQKEHFSAKKYIRFEIRTYQDNELWYIHWENFLASFSGISEEILFSVYGNASSIQLYIQVPKKYKKFVENVFYASFPTSDILAKKTTLYLNVSGSTYLKFPRSVVFYDTSHFSKGWSYVDPFKDLLSMYFSVPHEAKLHIQYAAVFDVKDPWYIKIVKFLSKLWKWKKKKPDNKDDEQKEKQDNDIKESWRDVKFTIAYSLEWIDGLQKKNIEQNLVKLYDKFVKEWDIDVKSLTYTKKAYADVHAFANFFHVPTKANQNKSLKYIPYRKLAYPVDIPTLKNTSEQHITLLWTTDYKDSQKKFGIKKEDKFRHVYIVGKTGMGKSTFISNMVRSDMIRDNGIAVIDPHGDLIEDVMAHIPKHRTNDVVIFDVSDIDHPVWFNILEYNAPDEKNLIASSVVSIFKKLFEHSRWPRLEYILRNVMLSILEYPNATLMHILRMLTDKNFREEVLKHVTDPVVMKFWRDEYDKWQDRQKNEAVGPIANKVGQFLSSPIVRNIFAQPKSSLHIRKIMDEWKILLVNLSKGKIGEDNSSMIWSFLVSKFQIDAMSRADIPFKQRRDFYLYIDEFQNFATDSFESILSEARKYRLSLIVANQYTTQIQENVRNAIFGNVWSVVSFWLWYDDATMMSQQFKELISPNDLLSLPKFTAYTKLMVDGVTSDPFSMKTFPLPDPTMSDEIKQKMRKQSRQRYGMKREKLEALLKAWAQKQFTEAEKVVEKAKQESVKDDGSAFSTDDIKLSNMYQWYVKLKYNYGLFVTVKWVEGLLHKSQVVMPNGLPQEQWKWLYEIGDPIQVIAQEFKDINGIQRVVWTQKK